MSVVNLIVGSLVGAILWPFQASTPLAGLTAVSLVLALALLAVFKVASNQRGIAAVRREMQASLFELRLFEHDPRAVVRAVGDLFRQQASYLRYALVPLLWIAIPLVLLIAHLQAYYGYEGLRPGEPAVVTVRLKALDGAATASESAGAVSPGAASPGAASPGTMAARPTVSLEAPPGVRIETPAVWTPSLRELAWRVAADQPGEYDLRIAAPSTVTKRLSVTPFIVPRAIERPAPAFWTQLQHPAEAPLPDDSPIDAIAIAYPARAIDLFGVPLHWLVILFVFSTVFAFACRRLFGVVI